MSPEKVEQAIGAFSVAAAQPEDATLKQQLIDTAKAYSLLAAAPRSVIQRDQRPNEALAAKASEVRGIVCSLIGEKGWPRRSAVGSEGQRALLYLITQALPLRNQLELYPIVIRAFRSGDIEPNDMLASYIDRLRVAVGMKQLFGTQALSRGGFLVLAPLEHPGDVDNLRSKFHMTPLREYERILQSDHRMPLIRDVSIPPRSDAGKSTNKAVAAPSELSSPLSGEDERSVLNIETAFVMVDVLIPDAAVAGAADLGPDDFRLFDNDQPQKIETFSKVDTPFDIVLLLDLSGSTASKVGLIKKTTKRFIEMKRETDRLAIITFNDVQTVVSELEPDKQKLLQRTKNIGGRGASYVWDALDRSFKMLNGASEKGRRKAVVIMSDGADNALTYTPGVGSAISFADLVAEVQQNNISIFPIYLDTEGDTPEAVSVNRDARLTLSFLAEQSAGNMYFAKKLEDLEGIYDRVLKDVGTVYTLGFTPDPKPGDDHWRRLKIETPDHPNLKIKYRPGYFVR